MGLCFLAAALVNLVQIPLVKWTLRDLGGDCNPLLLISLLSSLPLPVFWIAVRCRQAPQLQFETLYEEKPTGGDPAEPLAEPVARALTFGDAPAAPASASLSA
jgi:hypothetical protein